MKVLLLLILYCALSVKISLPHILFIVADDYGWNDVGYHQNLPSSANPTGGRTTNHKIFTPVIDQLAAEGMKLENYYVQPLCSPTRSTIMTGRYPFHTGMGPDVLEAHEPFGLPAREKLLPEFLSEKYWTSAVGKWHLGMCDERYTPTFRGFQEWTGYLAGAEDYFSHSHGNLDFRNGSEPNVLPRACPEARGRYSSGVFADEVSRMVSGYRSRNETRPLFMYVAFQATHNPYQAPDSYSEGYELINSSCSPAEQQLCTNRFKFAGMATGLDWAVGNVTAAFRRAGLWEDTLLVFTTDNGAEYGAGSGNNYPLRGGKVTNWEGGIRGVSFVRGTDSPLARLSPGVNMNLFHSTDWLPTLCSLAGLNCAPDLPLDGFDQWAAMQGAPPGRTHIWHNVPDTTSSPHIVRPSLSGGALRIQEWKFLVKGKESGEGIRQIPPPGFKPPNDLVVPEPYNGTYWLFNITADPTESYNLACSHPQILLKFIEQYNLILTSPDYVYDLATRWGYTDPNSDPSQRADKTWGPWVNRTSCAYGREFAPDREATGNLPHSGPITIFMKLLIAFHVLAAYPIFMNVLCKEAEVSLITKDKIDEFSKYWWVSNCVRFSLVGLTVFVAHFVPYLADFMSFLGGVAVNFNTYVLPTLFYLKLKPTNWIQRIVCLSIMALSIFAGCQTK